jgi:hypothetical protein
MRRLLSSSILGNDGTVFKATMSFGFSVGDFLTAIELANRIRTRFVDAPDQFKAISDESVSRIPTTFLQRYPILLLLERY